MAQIDINVAVVGGEKLVRLAAALQPRVILKVIGERLKDHVDESFRTRGRGKWKPLAWSTVALRQRGGSVPLQDTGRYRASFVTETDGANYVEIGTNLKAPGGAPLGPIHEFGTGPYTIRIRQARVLAAQMGSGAGGAVQHGPLSFLKSGGGRGRVGTWLFFGKEVHHPGVPARPVLPTKAEAERLIGEAVEGMLERVVEKKA